MSNVHLQAVWITALNLTPVYATVYLTFLFGPKIGVSNSLFKTELRTFPDKQSPAGVFLVLFSDNYSFSVG